MVSSFAIRTAARFPDENFTVSSYLPSYGHNSVVRGCLCRMRWDSVPASENTARTLIALGGVLVHPMEAEGRAPGCGVDFRRPAKFHWWQMIGERDARIQE